MRKLKISIKTDPKIRADDKSTNKKYLTSEKILCEHKWKNNNQGNSLNNHYVDCIPCNKELKLLIVKHIFRILQNIYRIMSIKLNKQNTILNSQKKRTKKITNKTHNITKKNG